MKTLRPLILILSLTLLPLHAFGEEKATDQPPINGATIAAQTEGDEVNRAPEPNTMILAGLGGMALLFFALRKR